MKPVTQLEPTRCGIGRRAHGAAALDYLERFDNFIPGGIGRRAHGAAAGNR